MSHDLPISDEANLAVEQLYDVVRYRQNLPAARDRVKQLLAMREARIRELEAALRTRDGEQLRKAAEHGA